MLTLPDAWTWDFWIADDGAEYHMYYLKASRALGDPDRRHWHATVGHAVSADLVTWREVADALAPGPAGSFDDVATWTGSVVRSGDTWHMFYTGSSSAEQGLKQRIGVATSTDLHTWHKHDGPILAADPRWYETLPTAEWKDEAFRDPWVFRAADGWHMLITARSVTGPPAERGVIGHAVSADLRTWTLGPPLSAPGTGFGHLEVPQIEVVDGAAVLLFSCLRPELAPPRTSGGVWSVAVEDPLGPYDTAKATRLTDESLYSGRLVRDRSGRWVLLAFENADPAGGFVGRITDPIPVGWQDGVLTAVTALRAPA